jgi:hypothetical protein
MPTPLHRAARVTGEAADTPAHPVDRRAAGGTEGSEQVRHTGRRLREELRWLQYRRIDSTADRLPGLMRTCANDVQVQLATSVRGAVQARAAG